MTPLNDDERKALLKEVVAYTQPPILERDEFTRSDYMAESGIGMSGTKNRLEHLVDDGILERRMVMDPRTNRQVWAYRKVREIPPPCPSPTGGGDRSANRELADQEEETRA